MSELNPTHWARERFGAAAGELRQAVTLAIHRAHGLAMDAHISSTLQSNDTYGATLHVTQHEQLVEHARDLPGVAIRKPTDVRCRFDLVVNDDPPVVLYPWRYATDPNSPRDKARLRQPVSDLRRTLLTLNANTVDSQLTLDQAAELESEQMLAEFAEEQAVLEELAKLGKVVTVGFASNPIAGIFALGWGDVELVDVQTGRVAWLYWEDLPETDELHRGTVTRPATPPGRPDHGDRFDNAPMTDDLGLRLRPPLESPPDAEPQEPQPDTGSDGHE